MMFQKFTFAIFLKISFAYLENALANFSFRISNSLN